MSYINAGVKINGEHAKSKKAIKDALTSNPASVLFYTTSPFGRSFSVTADNLDTELNCINKLSIVGPDPFNNRKWYGTVENTAKGIKVS